MRLTPRDRRPRRMARRLGVTLTLCLIAFAAPAPGGAQQPVGYVVVDTFPHDPEAFTQGLDFHRRRLFEGTGLEGRSELRSVDLESGEVRRRVALADRFFGEGITYLDGKIYQITWQSERAFVYDADTFQRLRRFTYDGEGWGLTNNGRFLIMSNGTSTLRWRDPRTFGVRRSLEVTYRGESVSSLNELEWVEGEIFANVWPSDLVARIDPKTGEVSEMIDLQVLREREEAERDVDVTNGIAYMGGSDRLFVTGKLWGHLYEIRLTD